MLKALYKKYQVANYENLPALSPLGFILRKAESAHDLTVSEWNWLEQHREIETVEIIKTQESYRKALQQEIKQELLQLKKNHFLYYSMNTIPSIDSESAFICYKVNAKERLADNELRFVGQGYHRSLDFNDKKQKYGITEKIDFNESAEKIISKLESKTLFCAADIEWLCTHKAYSFLTPLKKQFSQLQVKYKANPQDKLDVDLLFLFYILQKSIVRTVFKK